MEVIYQWCYFLAALLYVNWLLKTLIHLQTLDKPYLRSVWRYKDAWSTEWKSEDESIQGVSGCDIMFPKRIS